MPSLSAERRRNWPRRDLFASLPFLLHINLSSTVLLLLAGILLLIIDPYLSESMRRFGFLTAILPMFFVEPTLWNFMKLTTFYECCTQWTQLRYGTLLSLSLIWMRRKIVPPVFDWCQGEITDDQTIGDLTFVVVPFAFYVLETSCIIWRSWIYSFFSSRAFWIVAFTLCAIKLLIPVVPIDPDQFLVNFVVWASLRLSFKVYTALKWAFILPFQAFSALEGPFIAHFDKALYRAEPFKYNGLTENQTTRLLRIYKRKSFSGLRCEMFEVTLDEAPPYQSISYLWGTEEPSKPVLVSYTPRKPHETPSPQPLESRPMLVRDTVYDVIKYRHSFWRDHVVWMDSLCINQSDTSEKGQQVPLMGSIYAQAICVIACLGDVKDGHTVSGITYSLVSKRETMNQAPEDMRLDFNRNNAGWKELANFFGNPWFSRVWIIQEIAMANQVHMVFGNVCMDWNRFATCLDVLRSPLLVGFLCGDIPQTETMEGLVNARKIADCRTLRQYGLKVELAKILEAGTVVDVIAELGRVAPIFSEPGELWQKHRDWILEALEMAERRAPDLYFLLRDGIERQSLREAFWRTVIANRTHDTYPANPSVLKTYEAYEWMMGLGEKAPFPTRYKMIADEGDLPADWEEKMNLASAFQYYVGAGSLRRRIALTERGYLAIVPPKTQIGDTVAIIWGSQIPHLLRPRIEEIEGESAWELVACCYLHVLMNGEADWHTGQMFTLL